MSSSWRRPDSIRRRRSFCAELGSGVVELVEDFAGDTYRAVYTVRFSAAVYVLHAFKKKSKRGRKTPQSDVDLIKRRLTEAERDYAQRYEKERKR